MYGNFRKFSPKKPVNKFTDLDVYQQAMAASVLVLKDIKPSLVKFKYQFSESLINSAAALPLWIAEAHSIRFGDHGESLAVLEKVMAGCNKMVAHLEQIKGVYGSKLDISLLDDLIKRYHETRTKVFRLAKSWQKWHEPKK